MPRQAGIERIQERFDVVRVETPFLLVIAGQASHLHADVGVVESLFDGFFEAVGALLVFFIGHAVFDARVRPGNDDQVLIDLACGRRRQAGAQADHDQQIVDAGFAHGPEVAWKNTAH